MRKQLLLINFTCCILHSAFSQNPLVKQWDQRFGGTSHDPVYTFQQTADGGYILGGESYSDSSGDKTKDNWDVSMQTSDFWIVKIDASGNKQWDQRFGGADYDYLLSLQQTTDGGYILGGSSFSDSSGDKTQHSWGMSDYWIVKTDSLGNKQWDKRFGGTALDELSSVQQTADGGYILGGYSYSDSSGDKTQHPQGQDDYWMVKTDSLGIKQWDKRFGGSGYDEAYTLQQTADGGYIIGGYTTAGNSGDVTQTLWGGWDYWIVKTNASGSKQWDKRFGGTNDDVLYALHQTLDGGYILNGCSKSDSTGDKTHDNWDPSFITYDLWVVKIDAFGIKQWDRTLGGTDDENLAGNITQTADKGYLIPGTSYSGINGTKTENNLGVEQAWITKTDSMGNQQWDKTALTDGHDEAGLAFQTDDGCYALVTGTFSGIAGYKTQPNWDITNVTYDYWIVKFCDTTTSVNEFTVYGLQFTVFPNPASDILNVIVNKSENILVYNLFGGLVMNRDLTLVPKVGNNKIIELDISSLPAGVYFIKAGNQVRKFIKVH